MQAEIEKRLKQIDEQLMSIEDDIFHTQIKLNALLAAREELEEENDELIKALGYLEDV